MITAKSIREREIIDALDDLAERIPTLPPGEARESAVQKSHNLFKELQASWAKRALEDKSGNVDIGLTIMGMLVNLLLLLTVAAVASQVGFSATIAALGGTLVVSLCAIWLGR